jgi:hypothetical protein
MLLSSHFPDLGNAVTATALYIASWEKGVITAVGRFLVPITATMRAIPKMLAASSLMV